MLFGSTKTRWLNSEGVEHGVPCKCCGTYTACRFGWCFSCEGNMRAIDGLLWKIANAAERVCEGDDSAKLELKSLITNVLNY